MANQEHVDLFKRGARAVAQTRAAQPDLKFDLSGAELRGFDLRDLDLSGSDFRSATLIACKFHHANLAGCDFSHARLDEADFTGADLSDANFTEAHLSQADLTGVEVTSKTILKCVLGGAKFSHEVLREANIAGADLSNHDLQDIDLSRRDLRGTQFNHTKLGGAKFLVSNLERAEFQSSILDNANFTNANLSDASLSNANLRDATLAGSNLYRANLSRANFTFADVSGANFREACLTGAVLEWVVGTYSALHLRTAVIGPEDVRYHDEVIRKWPERWVDWERLRIAGRLPLFGASYSALILIPAYLYALEIYNEKVQAARSWIETSAVPAAVSKTILAHLHEEPIPSRWGLLLVSTILLAAASTIYALACPSRIKSFSRDEWCDQHRRSLVHYWADAWTMRPLRLACAAMYLLGGAGALFVLVTKLWCAGAILFGSPSACL